MSSPPPEPGNAAPAALVSTASAVDNGCHVATINAPSAPAAEQQEEQRQPPPGLSNHQTPFPETSQTAEPVPLADLLSPSTNPSQHVDYNKKARRPAPLQSATAPSLLTQALASARGIPSRNQPEQPAKPSPQSPLDSPTNRRTSDRPSNSELSEELPNDESIHQRDVGPLTPRGSSRATNMASSAAIGALPIIHNGLNDKLSSLSSSIPEYTPRDFNFRDYSHNRINAPPRGTSLERTPRERTSQEALLGATNSHPTAFGEIISTRPLPSGPPASIGTDNPPSEVVPPQRQSPFRPRNLEHRLSMGPEKIWSIGSGEHSNGQDGQVEKSITEVLAGVEPNARSRKASHSLRFFREGLPPDDKAKRKDARSGGQGREKLLQTKELEISFDGETLEDDVARPASAHASPPAVDAAADNPPRLARLKAFPSPSPGSQRPDESSQGYFAIEKDDVCGVETSTRSMRADEPDARASDVSAVPGTPGASTSASFAKPSEGRRRSGGSTEGADTVEEGEESGEEKISSALFVPHQGPEDAPSSPESVPSSIQGPVPASRTLSRTEDFHPWLVKADEPEPDERKLEGEVHESDHQLFREKARNEPVSMLDVGAECAIEEDFEVRPVHAAKLSQPPLQYHEDLVHDHHNAAPKQPLEAIELIPYKHQVGGHTTLWRFSRRAVCKQLNNRENEFYEKIERYHRDLLAFLPRYIGVLNVTFHKQPRRKSTVRRDDTGAEDRKQLVGSGEDAQVKRLDAPDESKPKRDAHTLSSGGQHHRVISQSLKSSNIPIPTVTFVDNQHILPRNLLQPNPVPITLPIRIRSTSASATSGERTASDTPGSGQENGSIRPSLEDKHSYSWGATMVNKRLRNEVFNDAFLKQPIDIQKHKRGHHRSISHRTMQRLLRPAISDSNLINSQEIHSRHSDPSVLSEESQSGMRKLSLTRNALARYNGDLHLLEDTKDVTGTSAPEPKILGEKPPTPKKRRYSGTGLRRKPIVGADSRGDLKYFEEADDAGYGGDNEEITQGVPGPKCRTPDVQPLNGTRGFPNTGYELAMASSNADSAMTSEYPTPSSEFKIPRPINPKEAQTQKDSRVEYFLLLEDLTAGMKRPCIMDLKMGTRQYGVEANAKKQLSQRKKCAETTSRELGVRICGLQVWDAKSQSYIFKDKYFGRDLKAGKEFQAVLRRFLYDGIDQASILQHITTVLQKLSQLEIIIGRLRGYRFYAASLLMFYDGEKAAEDSETSIEDSTTDWPTDTEDARAAKKRRNKGEIDFKMADFANSVTAGDLSQEKPCPPRNPTEPDRGFLRGLRSLRKYFLMIQRETRAELGLVSVERQAGEFTMDIGDDGDEGTVSE